MSFSKPLKVFISYAHEDEDHRQDLVAHLRALERAEFITLSHDRKITAGKEWAGAIAQALRDADIILLLISADFINSDYCNDVELEEALRRHEAGEARVVPVILRSCDWQHTAFARFNALPPEGTPVVESAHPDQGYHAVASGLRTLVAELCGIGRRDPKPPAPPPPNTADVITEPEPSPSPAKTANGPSVTLEDIQVGWLKIKSIELSWSLRLLGYAGLTLIVLSCLAAWGIERWVIRGPVLAATTALRMARYDLAVHELGSLPTQMRTYWPGLSLLYEKATLGKALYARKQDWEGVGEHLRRLQADHPDDRDLQVLQATLLIWSVKYNQGQNEIPQATVLLEQVVRAEPAYPEAWFLRGLLHDLAHDPAGALADYRNAVNLAPETPHYRGNLARTYLELGQPSEALNHYRRITQYPLGQVERALAHWTQAEWQSARDAQQEALKELADPALQGTYYNRRDWVFPLWEQNTGVPLSRPEDKRCYAALGEAASWRLAGDSQRPFPPTDCPTPAAKVQLLVADDLCRFVDRPQPQSIPIAQALRAALQHPEGCPPKLPTSATKPSV